MANRGPGRGALGTCLICNLRWTNAGIRYLSPTWAAKFRASWAKHWRRRATCKNCYFNLYLAPESARHSIWFLLVRMQERHASDSLDCWTTKTELPGSAYQRSDMHIHERLDHAIVRGATIPWDGSGCHIWMIARGCYHDLGRDSIMPRKT